MYFRKEGRSLGEVTKYLVYNARKRSGDNASEYFERTEKIAGVKGEYSSCVRGVRTDGTDSRYEVPGAHA